MCIIILYLAFIGLTSSNMPNSIIRNDAIKIDNINSFFGAKSMYPSKKLRNIPIPPNKGIGFL